MSRSSSQNVTKAVVLVETTAKDVSATEPYRVLSRSKGCGTAFRVRRDLFPAADWNCADNQLYLTNYHVIEGAEDRRVRIRVASSPEYTNGTVVHCVPALDFALIAVNMNEDIEEDVLDPFCSAPSSVLAGVLPVELHVGEVIPSAQSVLACGFPMGYLEQFISRGTLAGRQSCGDATTDFFSCDLSLNSGNSGGPIVFDGGPCDGQCFAISTATEGGDAIQISYAVPISVVLQWLANYYTGQVLGIYPRWSFGLCSRTDAFDDEHRFPNTLDGAIVCDVAKECKYDIKKGDVLVSINRGGVINKLDRFGLLTDVYHGDPKFSIMNRGWIAGCSPKSTSVTVWRPSLKSVRTFPCAPEPPLKTEVIRHAEFNSPHYALFGSCVFIDATADFLGGGTEEDSDYEDDGIPPAMAFHVLRKIHEDKSKMVTVLSHFHCNSYVSSTRTLRRGDIICKLGRTEIKDSRHAEKVIQKIAAQYAQGVRKRIKVTTADAEVWLDLDSLLQEERLVAGERGDISKLFLLKSYDESQNAPKTSRVTRKRKTRKPLSPSASIVVATKMPNSRPGSPVQEKRRRRSSRLASIVNAAEN